MGKNIQTLEWQPVTRGSLEICILVGDFGLDFSSITKP